MTDDEKLNKWAEAWQRADEAMSKIHQRELSDEAYYNKHQELLNAMLNYALKNPVVRPTSGLVEQQALFRRYYQKIGKI